ncbi:MAG TPA: type II toxin-antitoxin system HicA family toxin [Ktedonobacterales bacterium]
MSQWEKLLRQVLSGRADANIAFADLCGLLERLGYAEHIKGDHHIFRIAGRREIIDIQPQHDSKAKPYQVRQIRALLRKYGVTKLP